MTEAEWLTRADPKPMLDFLKGTVGERKLRLFACAASRRVWNLLKDKRSRTAVKTLEAYALFPRAIGLRLNAYNIAHPAVLDGRHIFTTAELLAANVPRCAATPDVPFDDLIKCLEGALFHAEALPVQETRRLAANWLRDIVGNPFRKVTLDVTPVAPAVASLAKTIDDARSYGRMLELADALEQAGYTDAGLLAHCRGPGPHVLGCWALELLLGRS